MIRPVGALLVALIVLSAQAAAQTAPIGEFFDEFTAEWVRSDPNLAVHTRYFSGEEQDRLERELTPATDEFALQRIALAREGLERLKQYDLTALTATERVAAEVMQWQMQTLIDSEPFLDYEFPLEQMNGVNVWLPNQFTVVHPLRTARDAANYVERLQTFDERMVEATAAAARRAQSGILPPSFILSATIEQMQRFMTPPDDNPLVTNFEAKIGGIEGLTDDRRRELRDRARRIVRDDIYPAWAAAIKELERQRPHATDDAGLLRFPAGPDVYAYQLRRYTTTDLSADRIHDIGLAEVARLEAEMDRLFRQIGLSEGSINERIEILRERLAYPETDTGREQIMRDINAILLDAQTRSALLFDKQPSAPVVAKPYPPFRWQNAAASYNPPPLDGSRPGVFQMPLRRDRLTKFSLRSLVYHETVPGHHFQIALANENTELPRFIQTRAFGGISATVEGWALYAERLAAESGWFDGDIEGLIGQLYSALWRARRLVVDTGLHAKGWTRQQGIDYGIPVSEVERYVVYPGQACSYMIGQLRIVELRERAREALGGNFSIRDFHNVVLGMGSVPLTILERGVERYIASRTDLQ